MLFGWRRASQIVQISGLVLFGSAAFAQTSPAWVDPPTEPFGSIAPRSEGPMQTGPRAAPVAVQDAESPALWSDNDPVSTSSVREAERAAPVRRTAPVPRAARVASTSDPRTNQARTARDLAFRYLDTWSAQNRVSLASAPSFYGSSVMFHGRRRSLDSLLAEKRAFAERWPDRDYRYRPETTQVACEADGSRCTVWSLFDFSAGNARVNQRSRGIGMHELVVSFAADRPIITSENSKVLRRGAVVRR